MLKFFIYSGKSPFPNMFCKYFFLICEFSFTLMSKVFKFWHYPFHQFFLLCFVFSVFFIYIYKENCIAKVMKIFSFVRVLVFIFMSIFCIKSVNCMRWGSFHFSPQLYLSKNFPSPLNYFDTFVKNQVVF